MLQGGCWGADNYQDFSLSQQLQIDYSDTKLVIQPDNQQPHSTIQIFNGWESLESLQTILLLLRVLRHGLATTSYLARHQEQGKVQLQINCLASLERRLGLQQEKIFSPEPSIKSIIFDSYNCMKHQELGIGRPWPTK